MVDNAISLMDALAASEPDALIVECEMGKTDGHNFLRHLMRRYPHIPVVILGSAEHAEGTLDAHDQGAAAYVCKTSAATDLIKAVSAAVTKRPSV